MPKYAHSKKRRKQCGGPWWLLGACYGTYDVGVESSQSEEDIHSWEPMAARLAEGVVNFSPTWVPMPTLSLSLSSEC